MKVKRGKERRRSSKNLKLYYCTPLRVIFVHLHFPRLSLTNDDDRTVGMPGLLQIGLIAICSITHAQSTGSPNFTAIRYATAAAAAVSKMLMLIGWQSGYPSIRHFNGDFTISSCDTKTTHIVDIMLTVLDRRRSSQWY